MLTAGRIRLRAVIWITIIGKVMGFSGIPKKKSSADRMKVFRKRHQLNCYLFSNWDVVKRLPNLAGGVVFAVFCNGTALCGLRALVSDHGESANGELHTIVPAE